MTISAVSGSSGELSVYFNTRRNDLLKLGEDLRSGDITAAQSDVTTIQTLGQNGPFPNGQAFLMKSRQADFDAVGQALQSHDLSAARHEFDMLAKSFGVNWTPQGSGPGAEPARSVNSTI